MYLQVLAQRARVPLRRQRDGCVVLHFPPILAAPTVLPPGSTLNFSMLFLKNDTRAIQHRRQPFPRGGSVQIPKIGGNLQAGTVGLLDSQGIVGDQDAHDVGRALPDLVEF
jgi:hypothetical protein